MGSGLFSYRWMPESLLLNDTLQNPQTINLTVDTVFIVRVSDLLTGCKASDTIRVRVVRGEGPSECIVIHNVITPNGDGLNDHWVIDCIELYPGNSVQIFNRWGDRIRSYQNYDNTTTCWEGTDSEGRPLPVGTYFYFLIIPGVLTLNGWVYLRNGRK